LQWNIGQIAECWASVLLLRTPDINEIQEVTTSGIPWHGHCDMSGRSFFSPALVNGGQKMPRRMLILGALLGLWNFTAAVLAQQGASRNSSRQPAVSQWAEGKNKAPAPGDDHEFVITAKTEIKLDGKDCKYEDVPDDAEIVLLEVAADRRTILIIHFESKQEH
jgi:hypothetical protein